MTKGTHLCLFGKLALLIYSLAYLGVRYTHTWHWFEPEHDRRVNYTLFDSSSRLDDVLYVVMYPACVADAWLTGRTFDRDKW